MGIMVRRTTNRDYVVYVKIAAKPNYSSCLFKKINKAKDWTYQTTELYFETLFEI